MPALAPLLLLAGIGGWGAADEPPCFDTAEATSRLEAALSSARPGRSSPAKTGAWTQSLTIFVADVVAHYSQSISCGIKIVEEPHETVYGEFQYAAEDLEGHLWIFSQHFHDLSPEDWGGKLAGG